jgi:membrane-associated HD superfamily phosphohydrolase
VEKSAIKIGLSFNVLFDFAMMLFIVFMRKYYNLGKNKKFNLFFNLYFLGVCSYLLFNNYFVIATRFANYFRLALIILIPMLIDKIENKKIRFAVIALFIIIFSILFIRQLYVHIPIYLPYKMNWFGKVILIS